MIDYFLSPRRKQLQETRGWGEGGKGASRPERERTRTKRSQADVAEASMVLETRL